jgi:sec-independent protein translocase protein TatA
LAREQSPQAPAAVIHTAAPARNTADPKGGLMPNIGPMELIVVLVVALLILGPKKLPEVGRSVGRGLREFKGSITGEHEDREEREQERIAAAPATAEPVHERTTSGAAS